jgi:hypothetical protein
MKKDSATPSTALSLVPSSCLYPAGDVDSLMFPKITSNKGGKEKAPTKFSYSYLIEARMLH